MAETEGIWHLVSQGEWLNSIARIYSVGDPDRIWKHPENADLTQRRDGNVLYPGDWLFIPPGENKEESCATEAKHTFELQRAYDRFEVTLHDPDGKPYAQAKYRLLLDGTEYKGETDGDGTIKLEKLILPSGAVGSLELPDLCLRYPIQMGFLNPLEATQPADKDVNYDDGMSGSLMRLRNLGYYDGPVPDNRGESAIDLSQYGDPIMRFQVHKMGRGPEEANGELDQATRDAIDQEFLA